MSPKFTRRYNFYFPNIKILTFNIEQLEDDDHSWFPLLKAMCLGEAENKVNIIDILTSQFGNLSGKIDNITNEIEEKKKTN